MSLEYPEHKRTIDPGECMWPFLIEISQGDQQQKHGCAPWQPAFALFGADQQERPKSERRDHLHRHDERRPADVISAVDHQLEEPLQIKIRVVREREAE